MPTPIFPSIGKPKPNTPNSKMPVTNDDHLRELEKIMHTLPSAHVRFGGFELDLTTGELRSIESLEPDISGADNKVLLREQVFQVLRVLVEREGKIVTREEIKSRLWADDTIVDFDHSINATIKSLRRALGDSADNSRYVETLGRRGYRLMPPIEYLEPAAAIALEEFAPEAPTGGRKWRALAIGALLAVGAFSLWRYEVYRHRITLAPTDTMVLADIDNRTGDPVFDDALNGALRYEMEQTPYLNLLGLDKANATMGQMKVPPTTKISPAIARQICNRTGSRMVISDSIADSGNGYRLEMKALDCGSGATLAGEREDINSRNQVVHELGATAIRLRRKLGEPSDSLARFNQPLEKATSASLDALQAAAEGGKLYLTGDAKAALKIYQQAVELDPDFALVHGRMGAANLFLGDAKSSSASYTRAYELRDRLTEKDRLNTEVDYYGRVTGDWEKQYSSAFRLLEMFPRDVRAHANLRAAFVYLGQPDRAADEAAETARLQPSAYYFGSAIQSIRFASRFNEAKSWLAKADALKLDNSLIRRERLIVAFATGERGNVEKILEQEEKGSYREAFLHEHSLIEIQQGRFHSAEHLRRAGLGRTSKSSYADFWVVLSALEDAEVGKDAQARRYESEAAGRPLERGNKVNLALALARSGRTEDAGRLADQISAERPEDTLVRHYFLPTIRASIKLRQHDPAAAIDLLRGTASYDLAFTGAVDSVYPAYIRGLAYLALGDGQSAAAQFQKLIDNPGFAVRHVTGPLARLQLGRAQKMMGDNASARESYEQFLKSWKDADPDIPIYRQAKAEYALLQTNKQPGVVTKTLRSAR
jgi:DNA-binding winged helix-turn-helix (wHTH) protein/tetratricopeptide (TPR) repeat protein